MKKIKQNKGITLVALVITVIVLLILAGVAIGTLNGTGILEKAKLARDKYINAKNEENKNLEEIYSQLLVADSNGTTLQNVDMITLKALIQQEVQKATPAGTIIAYSVDKVPEGYLKCEGQAVSRTEYKALFDIIGTTYGSGDGSSTFNVPDLRGEFLRGTGENSHKNQGGGADVGTHQDGTKHVYFGYNGYNDLWVQTSLSSGTDAYAMNVDGMLENTEKNGMYWSMTGKFNNGTGQSYYTSRPTNTSVLYCIKY